MNTMKVIHRESSLLATAAQIQWCTVLAAQLEDLPEQESIELDASLDIDLKDLEFLLQLHDKDQNGRAAALEKLSPRRLGDVLLLADYLGCAAIVEDASAAVTVLLDQSVTEFFNSK